MNWCKNRYCSDVKTNTAAGAISANISLTERDIAHIAPSSTGKGPKTAPAKAKDLFTRPNRYWPIVATMPQLLHWPDRDQPFDYANSEVIAFITARCGVSQTNAIRIFDSARRKGVIKFDPITKIWCGTKGGRQ
jgi:hypothetical protein